MGEYMANCRFSTDRQSALGLVLEAQRQALQRHLGAGQLVRKFTDIESGRRHSNRPQLLAALHGCRKCRAALLIARLDRLAQHMAFIVNMKESREDFIACDMLTANRLTVPILAPAAEAKRVKFSK